MIGQIQFTQITDQEGVKYSLGPKKQQIINFANAHCKSMVARGGGVVDLRWRHLSSDMLVVELLVDVQEAMGANAINTIVEATAPFVHQVLGQG